MYFSIKYLSTQTNYFIIALAIDFGLIWINVLVGKISHFGSLVTKSLIMNIRHTSIFFHYRRYIRAAGNLFERRDFMCHCCILLSRNDLRSPLWLSSSTKYSISTSKISISPFFTHAPETLFISQGSARHTAPNTRNTNTSAVVRTIGGNCTLQNKRAHNISLSKNVL